MDINFVITGSDECVREAVKASPENTLFTGSVKIDNESYLYFSFVNRDALSYILDDITLQNGAEIEITRHDADAKGIQPKKDIPCI